MGDEDGLGICRCTAHLQGSRSKIDETGNRKCCNFSIRSQISVKKIQQGWENMLEPFLILKVRHPAVTGVYCIVRDSRSGCSNDFKCKATPP